MRVADSQPHSGQRILIALGTGNETDRADIDALCLEVHFGKAVERILPACQERLKKWQIWASKSSNIVHPRRKERYVRRVLSRAATGPLKYSSTKPFKTHPSLGL